MYDLVVSGGDVVTSTAVSRLDVAVESGKIAEVGPPGSYDQRAVRTLDATGCLVLPGGVDPHVHYNLGHNTSGAIRNEPQEYSYAAAFGGTTTIVDFAVQDAPLTLHEAIDAKKQEARGRMAVDYGLHAIV